MKSERVVNNRGRHCLSRETRASTIENLLQDEERFVGCYSKSNLVKSIYFPSDKFLPCSLILNTDKRHWVALLLLENTAIYFDPLGAQSNINRDILDFLGRKYDNVVYNKKKVQHDSRPTCGLFCCSFIKYVKNLQDYYSYLDRFSLRYKKKNDRIAFEIFNG